MWWKAKTSVLTGSNWSKAAAVTDLELLVASLWILWLLLLSCLMSGGVMARTGGHSSSSNSWFNGLGRGRMIVLVPCSDWLSCMNTRTGSFNKYQTLQVSNWCLLNLKERISPIWAECPRLETFLDLTASLIRSTSCWYRLRSLRADSLAFFRAVSRTFTRSAVALSRRSSFGSSQRRSALSRTSWKHRDMY